MKDMIEAKAEAGASVPPLRLEWRSPHELAENPLNWRTHPEPQVAALTDVIAEVGWAGACLYNEASGRLIDGHARRKVALDQGCEKIPVLVGSWTEEQEALILSTLDPIAAMAAADAQRLDALLREVSTPSPALQQLLDDIATKAGVVPGADESDSPSPSMEPLPVTYELIVTCSGEAQQRELYERLVSEGLTCRVLTL